MKNIKNTLRGAGSEKRRFSQLEGKYRSVFEH